jgi:hypothetical protein
MATEQLMKEWRVYENIPVKKLWCKYDMVRYEFFFPSCVNILGFEIESSDTSDPDLFTKEPENAIHLRDVNHLRCSVAGPALLG